MLRGLMILLLGSIALLYPHNSLAQDTLENTYVFLLRTDPYSLNYPEGWEIEETRGGVIFTHSQSDSYVIAITDLMLYFSCDMLEPPEDRRATADDFVGCLLPFDWDISEPNDLEITNHSNGLLYQAQNEKTNEQVLALVIAYPDEELGIERYVLLWASSSTEQITDLQSLLVSMAASLKVGDEVALETASVRESMTISQDLLPNVIYPVALTDNHILGLSACGQIVEMSMDGTIINTIEQDECHGASTLYPAPDGSIWIPFNETENPYGAINYLLNLGPDGAIQTKIRFDEPFDMGNYRQPLVATDANGNVYMASTIEHRSEEAGAFAEPETETWIHVWTSEGEF